MAPPRRPFEPLTAAHYDAVVVGTALPQALLAAALARAGAAVLHLDPLSFYGSSTATLSAADLADALASRHPPPGPVHPPNPQSIPLPARSLAQIIFPSAARLLADAPLRAQLDLVPRPLMAAGPMVDLLVRSDVGHYLDFRPLDALYIHLHSGLRRVPASRSDVFQSRSISMPEKRLLMRFVKRCHECAEPSPPDGSFDHFMHQMALTPRLRTFLSKSIAFSSVHVPAKHAVQAVYKYQQSLMRFGTKTPFLYPNYGSGELAQAFCRLCAVHGGTYVLRRSAALVSTHHQPGDHPQYPVRIVTTENETVHARHVFIANDHMPAPVEHTPVETTPAIWRIAAVLDGSVATSDQPTRFLLTVPAGVLGNTVDVRIRQLDSSVMVCDSGNYVMYAETVTAGTESDVLSAVRQYVRIPTQTDAGEQETDTGRPLHTDEGTNGSQQQEIDCQSEDKPRMLWGVLYARPLSSRTDTRDIDSDAVVPMLSVEEGIDADHFIDEARRCFHIAKPDSEFFPATRREETSENEEEQVPNGNPNDAETVEAAGD